MTNNPFVNAFLAIAYIVSLVTVASNVPKLFATTEDNIFMPMVMLSTLVLSVSVMAYLFFYRPAMMLLDGKRQEAAVFFIKTVGTFAIGTLALLLISIVINR